MLELLKELLRDQIWGALAVIVPLVVGAALYYYRKRRNEKQKVRGLLTFLWSHRVLWESYSTLDMLHPVQSAESVRGIRIRLSAALEELYGTKAEQPIRDMHDACLKFLTEFESLPIPKGLEELISETQLYEVVNAEWNLGGEYSVRFADSLMQMRKVFETRMDELFGEYDIERLPPHEIERYKVVDTDPGEREPGEIDPKRE